MRADVSMAIIWAARVHHKENQIFGRGVERGFQGWSKSKAELDACITKAIAGVCCPTGGSSEAVDLYLDGKIEHWYSLQGKPGVAFIINVTDPTVAHEMLEKLSVHSREARVRNGAPFEVVR